MLALTRRNPFAEMLREMDNLFDYSGSSWRPVADVHENTKQISIEVELPGTDPSTVDVSLKDNILTIKGEKTHEKREGKGEYHRVERFQGSFSRAFTVPSVVDSSRISATYDQGVLTVTLPKSEEVLPRQIEVKSK